MKCSNRLFSVITSGIIYLFTITTLLQPYSVAYAQNEDSDLASMQASCREQGSGYRWDSNTNRCIRTSNLDYDKSKRTGNDGAREWQKEYERCQEMSDDDARKACHDKMAEHRVNPEDQNAFLNHGSWGLTAINASFAAITMFNIGGKDDAEVTCTYRTVFKVTSVAAFLFDLYFKFMAEKKLSELQDNYKDEAVNEDPYQAQVRAFNYLKDEQKEISKLAGLRFKQYMIQSIGYTATIVLAIYELTKETSTVGVAGDKSCYTPNPGGLAWLQHPGPTIGMAATGLVYAGVLAAAAKKEEDKAKERADAVEKIIKKFESSVAGYCPSGRDNLAEPRCYCYSSDGSKNKDRTNSESCQALWNNDNRNFFADANEYSKQKAKNPVGCMTRNRKFDRECKCKKLKDKSGKNACYKVPATATITMPGLANSHNKFLKNINDITNGNKSPYDLDGAAMANNAAKMNGARDKMLDKLNKDRKLSGLKPIKLPNEAAARAYLKKNVTPAQLKSAGDFALKSSGPSSSPKLAAALEKAKATPELKKAFYSGGGKGLGLVKKKKKKSFDLDFGNNGESGGKIEDGFMDKSYDYAKNQNDIVEREDVSIFQVITNRYNATGLQRLFDDEDE